MQKLSTTYLLFTNEGQNTKLQDQYIDILHKQYSNIFPEELMIQFQLNKSGSKSKMSSA